MTDEARQRAGEVGKAVSISPPSCYCSTTDFADWPDDVRKACSHCRQIDVIQSYGDREYKRGLEVAANVVRKHTALSRQGILDLADELDRLAQEARR